MPNETPTPPPPPPMPSDTPAPSPQDMTPSRRASIHVLPEELLRFIFDFAAIDLSNAIKVTSVCAVWRSIALSQPELWRSTRLLAHKEGYHRTRQVTESLLRLCADRSGNTITNLDVTGLFRLIDRRENTGSLIAACRGSRLHWKHLNLVDTYLCPCLSEPTFWWSTHGHPDYSLARYLLLLVANAPSLESIALNFTFSHRALLRPGPDAITKWISQPKTVILKGPWWGDGCYGCASLPLPPSTQTLNFVDWLARGVENFAFYLGNDNDAERYWHLWAWSRLDHWSSGLRSIKISAVVPSDELVTFPVLEQAVLFGDWPRRQLGRKARERDDPPIWANCSMPALKTLYASPSVAQHLTTPLVRTACFGLHGPQDLDLLSLSVAALPAIETLTVLIFDSIERYIRRTEPPEPSFQTEAVHAVLDLLLPSKRGTLAAPRLRHLGLFCEGSGDLDTLRREVSLDLDPHWASSPWNDADIKEVTELAELATSFRPCDDSPTVRMDLCADQLLQLERERTQLSRGLKISTSSTPLPDAHSQRNGDSASGESPVGYGPCAPLETIKLGCVRIEPAQWRTILRETKISVTCHPDPGPEEKQEEQEEQDGTVDGISARLSELL